MVEEQEAAMGHNRLEDIDGAIREAYIRLIFPKENGKALVLKKANPSSASEQEKSCLHMMKMGNCRPLTREINRALRFRPI